jgi:hypothetical protein
MFRKLFSAMLGQRNQEREAGLYKSLLRHEARIGGQLFGDVPTGRRREFFCLDEHTWVWHEEWTDQNGQQKSLMTRYDVRPDGVLKSQNGHYQKIDRDEAMNLLRAARLYNEKVVRELYPFAQ